MTKTLPPIHPGEVLREEFLTPMNLSAGKLARAIGVPRTRIERLVAEKVDLTPDTALRLGRYFGMSAQFWMGIQSEYALEEASDRLAADLDRIQPMERAQAV
jgi:addiction module HigA family antidote